MPRLTNHHYLYRHDSLRIVWLTWPDLYRLLTPTQQRQLHDYYCPAVHLTKRQALSHRRASDRARPTLGTSAGKAFASLHRAFQDICNRYPENSILDGTAIQHYVRHRLRQPGLSVSALVKPEPDLHKLAMALVRLAEVQQTPAGATEPLEPTEPA